MIKKISQVLVRGCVILALWVGMCGLGVLGYQVYVFLKQGYWMPLKAEVLLCRVLPGGFLERLYGGNSWAWVHKAAFSVFNWPLTTFLFVVSCVLFVVSRRAFRICPRVSGKEEQVSWRR